MQPIQTNKYLKVKKIPSTLLLLLLLACSLRSIGLNNDFKINFLNTKNEKVFPCGSQDNMCWIFYEPNPENRLFSMTVPSGGYLSFTEEEVITHQVLLDTNTRVVYFKDKDPVLEMDSENYPPLN